MSTKQKTKPILDACCGSRMFWFDQQNPNVTFVDCRNEEHVLCDGRTIRIAPDVVADFRNLPFEDNSFKLVVFDPPHLKDAGDNSWLAKKYGRLPQDWRPFIKQGFDECMRVLDEYGTLIFKWNEDQIPARAIEKAIGYTPLLGHKRMGGGGKTVWFVFMKFPATE